MIRVYHFNDRPTDCLCWSQVLRHLPADGIVYIRVDHVQGLCVEIEQE